MTMAKQKAVRKGKSKRQGKQYRLPGALRRAEIIRASVEGWGDSAAGKRALQGATMLVESLEALSKGK